MSTPGNNGSPSNRGSHLHPPIRFEATRREVVEDWVEDWMEHPESDEIPARAEVYEDLSESILVHNDSPDLHFEWSLNPYRGCEHGCAYCYARPTHEYLGWNAGIDFESRILVKKQAASLLERALLKPAWLGTPINMSGVTDCYQPLERSLRVTRSCLEVLARFRQPVSLITKNALILRDLDFLKELARHQAVSVSISMTTLDPQLRRHMEPRASPPKSRLKTVERLAQAGIPVGVLVAPIIPAINDHEILPILAAAAAAGATYASYVLLRLPLTVEPVFREWLQRIFPQRQEKVLNQLKSLRGGTLKDAAFGSRMRGVGPAADRLSQLFRMGCQRHGLRREGPPLSSAAFRRIEPGQLALEFG